MKKLSNYRSIATAAILGLALIPSAFAQNQKPSFRIAVPRFIVPTTVMDESGTGVTQLRTTAELREKLADLVSMNIKKFAPQAQLLERRELDQAVKTLKLQEDALFSSEQNSAKLGKFIKADYIVIGTITTCGARAVPYERLNAFTETAANEVVLNFTLRLLNVETAEILDVSTWQGSDRYETNRLGRVEKKDPMLALSNAAEKLTVSAADAVRRHFWTELPAAAVTEETIALKIGELHRVKIGTKMQIFELGAEAEVEGEKFRERILVGEAEITSVQKNVSIATIKSGAKLKKKSKTEYVAVRIFEAGAK